jgi:hypothetical protein
MYPGCGTFQIMWRPNLLVGRFKERRVSKAWPRVGTIRCGAILGIGTLRIEAKFSFRSLRLSVLELLIKKVWASAAFEIWRGQPPTHGIRSEERAVVNRGGHSQV